MARTAKTVELSKIINIETGKAYAVSFVKTMEMVGKDQSEWPMLEKIMSTSSEIESKQAKEKREKREANAKKKADRVAEILAELDVKLPEGILLKSVEVKPKGPMIDELDDEGAKTGEKVQDVTHYDIDLRWGKRGEGKLLRSSVSTGGDKKPKTEDEIQLEIDNLTKELVGDLLKIVG